MPRELDVAFLAIEVGEAEKTKEPTLEIDGKHYRRWKPGEELVPEKLRVVRQKQLFRKLKTGDGVKEGQLLALVNPALAIDELNAKLAKLNAAASDLRVSEKTKLEAQKRYDSAVVAKQGRAISEDDYRAAKLA